MSKFSIPDKLNLARLETPIQALPQFSAKLSKFGPVELFIKRDDLTHGVAAGNKIRKLEFLLFEAKSKGFRVVFTCGGIQSNHARATAVLCRELGLECVLFLRAEKPSSAEPLSANYLLDRLVGAHVEFVTSQEYDEIPKIFVKYAERYRVRDGRMPLFIPEGGSSDIGAMGYVNAFQEIHKQSTESALAFDSIVVANGSGGTHAGLLLGRNLSDWEDSCNVVSFNVCRTAEEMKERVKVVMIGAIQRWRMPLAVMPSDIRVIDGYVAPGYGRASEELYDFIAWFARETGIVLDPAYTGKAMFGLFSEMESTPERARLFGRKILFVHTGGLPSIFAHQAEISRAIVRSGI